MTTRFFLKALLVIWPFLRDAIFKNRTVSEVVKENWHLNVMFFLVCLLTIMLWFTTHAALTARDTATQLKQVLDSQPVCLSPEAQEKRRKRLIELIQ